MHLRIPSILLGLVLTQACNVIDSGLLRPTDAATDSGDAAMIDGPASDAMSDMPEPGLILRYAFEDSGTMVRDISGRHKDGTLSDPTAWTAQGRIGRGLALTGTQNVALPNGVLEGVDDFTIAAWVKVNTNADWARIYDFGNAGGDQFMYLTIRGYQPTPPTTPPPPPVYDGIHLSFYGGSQANENWFGTITALPTSVWKHLAVTGSGGDRRLYVDGFPAASRVGGPNVPPRQMEPMAPNSWLGKSRFPADPGLNGTLDDFRIYDRVLSPSQIQDLASPQRDYSDWRFDETSGTSAKDSSENAVKATLTAGVTWTTGRIGGAVKLPGAPPGSSGPHIALDTSPLAACTEFTVAVWVKLDAVDSSRIFDVGTGSANFIYLAVPDGAGSGMHFGMAASGKAPVDVVTTSPSPSADGLWHHVAVTLLSGTVKIYLDGAVASSQGGAAVKPTDLGATTENWIGRSRRAGDRFLNGALDELRIACRAYSADEIMNLSRPPS
jgi:hypothetical protein